MQNNLADWVEKTINNGLPYYEYEPNGNDVDNPLTVKRGYMSVQFVLNQPIRLGDNADTFEKYRQNITISITIEGV